MTADSTLLTAWRQGDAAQGNLLFQRHFPTVHRYFANKVANERDVEDLIQRTFLACVEGRDAFSGRSAFRTWLLGIAHNLLCEHYRRQHRGPVALDFAESSVRDLGAGPSTLLREQRDEAALLEGLRATPLDAQTILELYYWEQWSASEIGEFLDIPENTARSRIRRAKQQLLKALLDSPAPGRAIGDEDGLDAWAAEVRGKVFPDAAAEDEARTPES